MHAGEPAHRTGQVEPVRAFAAAVRLDVQQDTGTGVLAPVGDGGGQRGQQHLVGGAVEDGWRPVHQRRRLLRRHGPDHAARRSGGFRVRVRRCARGRDATREGAGARAVRFRVPVLLRGLRGRQDRPVPEGRAHRAERRCTAGGRGLARGREVRDQDAPGRRVRHRVVDREHHATGLRGARVQPCHLEVRPGRGVEPCHRFAGRPFGGGAEVHRGHGLPADQCRRVHRAAVGHHQARLGLVPGGGPCAQYGVGVQEGGDSGPQGVRPQAVRGRQYCPAREVAAPRGAQRRPGDLAGLRFRVRLPGLRGGSHPCQPLRGALVEDLAGGQHMPGAARPRGELHRHDRVAAQLEEAVLGPHPLPAEHLREQRAQGLLGGAARLPRRSAAGEVGGGQCLVVDLAVHGQREPVQRDERRRHHVLRQPPAHELAQRGEQRAGVPARRRAAAGLPGEQGFRSAARAHGGPAAARLVAERLLVARRLPAVVRGLRDDVRHQPALPRPVLAGHHHRLADRRVGRQRRFDLPRLDTETAHLDLGVRPPDEDQFPVVGPAHHVAGAVHPLTGHEGAGGEAFRRQAGAGEVAARQARAGDAEFARHPWRYGLEERVQYVHLAVVQRAADRQYGRHRVAGAQPVPGGAQGGLGRPVQMPYGHLGAGRAHPGHGGRRHHVTAGQHLAQPGEALR